MKYLNLLLVSVFSCVFLHAQHTFSIVAIDTITGEIGSAGATCLTSADCGNCGGAVIISGIIPGKGAINSQAQICIPNTNLNNGLSLLEQGGFSAGTLIDELILNDACIFGSTQDRQYGVVLFKDDSSVSANSFTGSNALDYAGHRVGDTYAIQGNILIGPEVLDEMENNFLFAEGTLADRLMAAMQGANIPGADERCLDEGLSSKSSYLRVAKPTDSEGDYYIDIVVGEPMNDEDPIDILQEQYDDFISTSTEDLKFEFSIFPNPSPGVFNIYSSHEITQLDCQDMNGKSVSRNVTRHGSIYQLEVLSESGVYVLSYSLNKRRYTQLITKVK